MIGDSAKTDCFFFNVVYQIQNMKEDIVRQVS